MRVILAVILALALASGLAAAPQGGNPALTRLQPLTPAPGEKTVVPYTQFQWAEHPDAFEDTAQPVRYDIEIARDAAFADVIDRDTVYLNRYVPEQPLPKDLLHWRVRAIPSGAEPESWSEAKTFSVIPCDETVEVEYDPDSDNHQPAVQAAVDRAVALTKEGQSVELVFPEGLYLSRSPSKVFFKIDGAKNLIVNGNGATVHMMEADLSFARIDNSRNVVVGGFTIDFPEQFVFTQGHVMSVDKEKGEIEVELGPGFPTYEEPHVKEMASLFVLLDPEIDGRLKTGVSNYYSFLTEKIRRVGDRRYILALEGPSYTVEDGKVVSKGGDPRSLTKYFDAGDRFVHGLRGYSGPLFFAMDCENLTVHDVTNYGSGSGHYLALYCSGVSLLHCYAKIQEGRWWEGNADGVHFRGNGLGPWIEDVEFNGIGDDGIALYARPMTIAETGPGSANRIVVKPDNFLMEPGDHVSFFRPQTGEIVVEPVVKSVEKAGENYLVEFSQDIPGPVNTEGTLQTVDQIWNRSKSCGDFVIRNSRFYGIRRYGNVFRAKRGVIENNLYQGVSSAAIMFLNETQYPNGLYCSDIIIRNNTMRECTFDTIGAGVISMLFKRLGTGEPAQSYGPKGILIENNRISHSPRRALELWSTRDVVLRANTVDGEPLMPDDEKQVRLLHVDDVQWLGEED